MKRLRALALSTVSERTLVRSTGPLGAWSMEPKVSLWKHRANYAQRQAAIIKAGIELGVVFKTNKGFEVRL